MSNSRKAQLKHRIPSSLQEINGAKFPAFFRVFPIFVVVGKLFASLDEHSNLTKHLLLVKLAGWCSFGRVGAYAKRRNDLFGADLHPEPYLMHEDAGDADRLRYQNQKPIIRADTLRSTPEGSQKGRNHLN
jgi:hypothetical protein